MSDLLVFNNAFLIDGTGGEPLENAAVLVDGETIREIHSEGSRSWSVDARVFDLQGKTLLPGLIDAHVHPGNVELRLDRTAQLPPAVYVHRVTQNLETDIDLGFTTLRDAGGLDAGFRTAVDQGLIRGPRLFLSVTPLNQSGSGDPAPRNSLGIYPEICDGPDEVRRAARRTLGRGADQIKIFADGEVVSQNKSDPRRPGHWKFTVAELRAAVETAESAGAYVMAHVYSPRAIQNCLHAGVRSIEHGNLMDAETAALAAEKGAFFVPTLTVYDVLVQKGREAGLDDFALEKLAAVADKGREAVELAYRAGVKIASGSDLIGPFQHLKGRELAIKAEILSPMGAIVSATRTNAELLGVEDRLGTVEPGKLADLIVVDGDPLTDPALFEQGRERVKLVVKAGRIMKNLPATGGE